MGMGGCPSLSESSSGARPHVSTRLSLSLSLSLYLSIYQSVSLFLSCFTETPSPTETSITTRCNVVCVVWYGVRIRRAVEPPPPFARQVSQAVPGPS